MMLVKYELGMINKKKIECTYSNISDPLNQLKIRTVFENLYPKEIKNVFDGDNIKYYRDHICTSAIVNSSPVIVNIINADISNRLGSKNSPLNFAYFWGVPLARVCQIIAPGWIIWSFKKKQWYASFNLDIRDEIKLGKSYSIKMCGL